jgi:hypothetical protein
MKIAKVIIKLIVAAMLYACRANILAEHYDLMKMASFVGFVLVGYIEFKEYKFVSFVLAVVGAFLLNPYLEMPFQADTWNTIYLILVIILIIWCVVDLFTVPPKEDF